jgi:hypothetical protein
MRRRRRRLGVVSASALSSSDVSSRVVSSCVWVLGCCIEFHRVLSRCDSSTHLRARLSRPGDPLSTTRKLGVNPTPINQPISQSLSQPRASVETGTYIDLIPSIETRVRDGAIEDTPSTRGDGRWNTHSLHVVSRHAVRVAGWEEDIEELVGIGLCVAWTLVDGLTRAGADGGRAHDDVDSRGRGNVGCGRGA